MTLKMILLLTENETMVPTPDVGDLVDMAVVAEAAGFDAVMISEHIVLGPSANEMGLAENPRDYALPGNQDPATIWPSQLVLAAYSISKAGLLMLSHSIAVDYGPRGVRSNVVCPGWTRSEMADAEMAAFAEMAGGGVEDAYEEVTRLVPQRRPGTSAEVAQAIIWLLSEAASYVNGATLSVDGGLGILEVGTIGYDFTVAPRA